MKTIVALSVAITILGASLANADAASLAEESTCQEYMVPMRDGVRLATDVYLPRQEGSFPVLVTRLPYGKADCTAESRASIVPDLLEKGYAVVFQDIRGRFRSEGTHDFFMARDGHWSERDDGYDTIEWAAAQPWSNGKVGTFGGSYYGMTQYALAPTRPPHLVAQFPMKAFADQHAGLVYPGGALHMAIWRWAFLNAQDNIRRCTDPENTVKVEDLEAAARDMDKSLRYMPRLNFPPLSGPCTTWFTDWMSHPDDGPWWWERSHYTKHDQIDVPMMHFGGWYDTFLTGTLENFAGIQAKGMEGARQKQKLMIGPWSHVPMFVGQRRLGQLDFGPDALIDPVAMIVQWYDYWLKGDQNEVADWPTVRIFVMGENRWRDENEWPLARTVYTNFYFSREQGNSDGILRLLPPSGDQPPDSYVYDPENPTPTVGGNIGGAYRPEDLQQGAADQREVEKRPDVLSFTTPPLDKDLEATGPITVKLFASSDRLDTDFAVILTDVYPDGRSIILADGMIRARYREAKTYQVPLEPGKVYAFTIDVWPTSNLFRAGHRIRVNISSSNFPKFDNNPNTGAPLFTDTETLIATNTIYHDSLRPSHIVLPVIPR